MTESDERYTHGHHESVLRAHSWRTVENSAAYLIPELRAGATILDVGSGPGTITIDLAQRVAPGVVTGLDYSADAVARAQENARQKGVENVKFVVGDAYNLPFEDDSFDIVHTHQTLQHVGRPVDVLREMRRVVKPGGVVAAREVDWAGIIFYPELEALTRWQSLYDAVHRSNGGEPNAGRRLKAWAYEAGFTDVSGYASVWGMSSDEDRGWWGETWSQRVLSSSFASDVQELGLATVDDLKQLSKAWINWRDDRAAWLAMPHGEILARA